MTNQPILPIIFNNFLSFDNVFLANHQFRPITLVLHIGQVWHTQRHQQSFLNISEAHSPCRDTIDRCVKIVESHIYPAIQAAAANDLLGNFLGFVIQ